MPKDAAVPLVSREKFTRAIERKTPTPQKATGGLLFSWPSRFGDQESRTNGNSISVQVNKNPKKRDNEKPWNFSLWKGVHQFMEAYRHIEE